VDGRRTTPGGGLIGVTVLVALMVASVGLFVLAQRHRAAPSFEIGAPFPAPCSVQTAATSCFAIRVHNVGDLAGTVRCVAADGASTTATFVRGGHGYTSAPIEPGREDFVLVQVHGEGTDGTDPPAARCAGA
jgi:hypothetical protein